MWDVDCFERFTQQFIMDVNEIEMYTLKLSVQTKRQAQKDQLARRHRQSKEQTKSTPINPSRQYASHSQQPTNSFQM